MSEQERNQQMRLHIVLVEPEIPQNTGNIARTCAATGAVLHLVHPLGFSIADRYLKRAGLDYWDKVDVIEHDSLDAFLNAFPPEKHAMFFASTKSPSCYTDVDYTQYEEVFVLFGKETKGLPEELLNRYLERDIRIPMRETLRSLNLSNSVAIVVYEILRQTGFSGLEETSHYLTK